MKYFINLFFIMSFLTSYSLMAAENDSIKIVIQSPIAIGKTKVALGKIISLSSKAIQVGYDEIDLKGSIRYKRLPNKRTRVKINWSSLKQTSGTTQSSYPLRSSLISQFVIDEKRLDAGVELSAKGDLEMLARSLDEALSSKAFANNNSGSDQSEDTSNATKTAQKINTPTSASVGGYPSAQNPSGGGTSGSGAKLSITSWEACKPRIDKAGGTVYEQAQKVTTLETGEETGRDSCIDKGTTAPIVKSYATCGTLEDLSNGFVYKKYDETATLNNTVVSVTSCTTDFNAKFAVKNDYSVCSVRHDFVNGISIQQEQFYYIDDKSARVDVGDCVDSSVQYTQYLTLNTCTATVDEVNGFVFPQKRIAYQDTSGTINYATSCAPVETDKVALSKEFCPQKYEHDFVAGQSYLRTQNFYNDFQTNAKILVGACSRDTTVSFPHIKEQASCTTEYDDANLMNKWFSLTQIDATSQGDGLIEIAPCAQYGNPTPYLFTGTKHPARTVLLY